jgi:hypothetical protein
MKYLHSYAEKKPAIVLLAEGSIPPGMTHREIVDLFEKSAPIPYVGEIAPSLIAVPKELIRKATKLEI